MESTILATKLFIPLMRRKIVARNQLIKIIEESIGDGKKITLISAPAGFGKTTLISEWISQNQSQEKNFLWISLDEADNDPIRFLIYIIAAIQTHWPDLGIGIINSLQSLQPPPINTALTILINEISTIDKNFTLVLDDYHVIENHAVDQALSFLIEHQPPRMHLIIASREEPDIPLSKFRVKNQLTELRASDLRFNFSESTDFLNQIMELNLSSEDVQALEKRTEGWVAGLQLAALAIRGTFKGNAKEDKSGFIHSFTGSHRYVLDYLLEEVLTQQTESIQRFLLFTSILNQMCGSLCDHLLQEPQQTCQKILETLEKTNLFIVPLDDKRQWYRYHHLFGDLLRQRMEQQLGTDEIAAYHMRASEWYEDQGMIFDAFQHAVKAEDLSRAIRLSDRNDMPLHLRFVTLSVLDLLDSLPTSIMDHQPGLWVKSATLALMAGQSSGVEEKLQAAEKILNQSENNLFNQDLTGRIACARATLALTRYDPEAMLVQAQLALNNLNPENLPFLFTAYWALGSALSLQGDRSGAAEAIKKSLEISKKSGDLFSAILSLSDLGLIQELNNELIQAEKSYQEVLVLTGNHPQPNIGEVYLGLAHIYYEWNDLKLAEKYGNESLKLSRQYDALIDRYLLSEIFLARLQLALGNDKEAEKLLALSEQSAHQQGFLNRLPEIAVVQNLVYLKQKRFDESAHLTQRYNNPLSQTRLLLRHGNPSEALAVLEPFLKEMKQKGWKDEELKTIILLSLIHQKSEEKDKALRTLAEAVTMAEPGRFIRIFIDEEKPMLELLINLKSDERYKNLNPVYIEKIISAFQSNQDYDAETDILSTREMEVLQLLAQGFTNQEICDHLYLAMDTVKGHNRRIFTKLQVNKRADAVKKAKALGLL